MLKYFAISLGPAALAWSLTKLGVSVELACGIAIATSMTAVIVGEFLTGRSTKVDPHDVVHALLSSATSQLCILATIALLGDAPGRAANLPLGVQVALVVLGSDFAGYWAHRAQHRVSWLWRGHAIHHMPRKLYWLNGLRAHPFDTGWAFIAATLWALIAGFSPLAFGLGGVIITSHLLLQHTTIEFPRRLEGVFVTPHWHEVHHDETATSGVNLAKVVTVWDRVFGTFRPSQPVPGKLGIKQATEINLWDELVYPFNRAR